MIGDTIGFLLQRTGPAPATFQSSASLSIIPNKDARGFPSWWRTSPLPDLLDTPSQICLPQHDTLLPLSHFFHEWERLPGVSLWVFSTVRSGYTLQFGRNPPPLRWSLADSSKQRLEGFCATAETFLPPTKGSNRGSTSVGHWTRLFQLLLPHTEKRQRPETHSGLASSEPLPLQREVQDADVEDDHVPDSGRGLVRHYRSEGCLFSHPGRPAAQEVPSVCLWREGLPIQGPYLWPGLGAKNFHKVHGCFAGPFEVPGQSRAELLDDWLILAHSKELVSHHRDIVLHHIRSLGLRMNAKKSVLFPSQQTVFLGVHLDLVQMQARLAPARISNFAACLARFKLGHHVSVSTCRRLLGLMAAASPVLPLGLLHMRPFLWWMKVLRIHPTVPATRLIRVLRSCFRALLKWRDPTFLQSRVRMGAIHRRHMITTDASMTGWGAVFEGRPAHGEWTGEFLSWHINCLKLRAVFLALIHFLPVVGKHHVIVRTDNMAVASHINRQGGSQLCTLDRLARRLLLWSQDKFLSLRAVHVPGISNLAADFLPRQKLRPGEWMLNRQTVAQIWDLFGKAEVDLFASQESSQCPLWFSLSSLATLGIDAAWDCTRFRQSSWFRQSYAGWRWAVPVSYS